MNKKTKGFLIGASTLAVGCGVTMGLVFGNDFGAKKEMNEFNERITTQANVDSFKLSGFDVYKTVVCDDMLRLVGVAQKGTVSANVNLLYMINADLANSLKTACLQHGIQKNDNVYNAQSVIGDKEIIDLLNQAVDREMIGYIESSNFRYEDLLFKVSTISQLDVNTENNTCSFNIKGVYTSKVDNYKSIETELKITQPYTEEIKNSNFVAVENYLYGREVTKELVCTRELNTATAMNIYTYETEDERTR